MAQESTTQFDRTEALDRFLKGLEPFWPVAQNLFAFARALDKQLQAFAESAAPALAALAQIDWVAAKKRLDELPEKSKAAMTLAASKGWFFGWHDSLRGLLELVETLASTSPGDIDDVMARYYRENFQPFANELISNHPDRAAVIKAAVLAHTTLGTDGYFLSVPVFIAQADGLLTELTNVQSALMQARNGISGELQASKALREALEADQESLDMVHPILKLHELDFMKNAAARQLVGQTSGESFSALNRHLVMHGESFDYGTELNSLKAFSFLVCVGAHLPVVLERDRTKTPGAP